MKTHFVGHYAFFIVIGFVVNGAKMVVGKNIGRIFVDYGFKTVSGFLVFSHEFIGEPKIVVYKSVVFSG